MRPGAEERDDAALLRGVTRGDEEALAALYDRPAGWLTVRMTRRCAVLDVVNHAVQDTFRRWHCARSRSRPRPSWTPAALPLRRGRRGSCRRSCWRRVTFRC